MLRILTPLRGGARALPRRLSVAASPYFPMTGPVKDPNAEPRFLEMVQLNFDEAAKHVNVGAGTLEVIRACNSLVRVNL